MPSRATLYPPPPPTPPPPHPTTPPPPPPLEPPMTQTSLTHLISAACADARSTPSPLDTTEATLRARARARHLHLDAFQPISIELLMIRTSCTCGRTYEAPNGGNPLLV